MQNFVYNMASLCFLLLLLTVKAALSAKILGYSAFGSGSHYHIVSNPLLELASRGHEVAMLVSSDRPAKTNEKIPHKTFQVPYKAGFVEDLLIRPALEGGKYTVGWNYHKIQLVMCECLLNNTELLQELKKFDLIVFDAFAPCGVLLSEVLDVPNVMVVTGSPNDIFAPYRKSPLPLSYVPMRGSGFPSNMTFIQRVRNVFKYCIGKVLLDVLFIRTMDEIKAKFNINPERSYSESYSDSALVIYLADFALDFPQPLLPGHIMVGPVTVQRPSPLTPDFESFVDNSGGYGFIMVSFGSYVEAALGKEKITMLATAFGKLKQRVLWRLNEDYVPTSLKPNIKPVNWLPQNDLLAHKDIKAFVSHVGHNSLYELAYHGVPVVAFPLFSDQFANAQKAEQFGLGIAVDHETTDAEQLSETIERVVNEPRFKTEAMRISQLMKDSPRTPLEKTADWIEHVLRHGAQHLRGQAYNIPWYQYYLLDVMAFLVTIVTLVTMVIGLTCRCLCRVCCRKGESKTKQE